MFSKLPKKYYLVALATILVLSIVGFAYYRLSYLPSPTSSATPLDSQNLRTAVVQQGDISVFSRGSGALVALNEIRLGFGSSGPVAEINVAIGDAVYQGDILATQGNREQFDAAVAADQLAVLTAKQNLDALHNSADLTTAQAQLDLINAQTALTVVENKWKVLSQNSQIDPSTLKKQVKKAWKELVRARDEFYASYANASPTRQAELLDNYSAAKIRYNDLLNSLNNPLSPTQQEKRNAELALAQAHVLQTEFTWEKLKNGADPDKVALAEQALASAEANLAVSQNQLDRSIIVAPTDGNILLVNAKVGDDVSTPFIVMANLGKQYLQISIDGADVGKIAVGYPVDVVFDALPNQIFTGKVYQIDPNLYDASGKQVSVQTPGQATLIKALVSLDENTTTTLSSLPLGMTASVDIIGGQATGVVLVPVDALHEQSPGKFVVYVLENSVQNLRPVEIGIMDFSFAEVKSGLKVGEVVVLGP